MKKAAFLLDSWNQSFFSNILKGSDDILDDTDAVVFGYRMKCLNLALVVAIISGCASNKREIAINYPTNEEYRLVIEKYRKMLDLQWVKKFADDPNFGKDFDNCRSENDIAQWIQKHFYIEINYCLDQLRKDWSDLLLSKSVQFAEDQNLMNKQLRNIEENFRLEILQVYVQRHLYYAKKGLIQRR